jgi:hypothetical protein
MRTLGSKNVLAFGKRTEIATSASAQVRHLANITGNPLNEFLGLLNHQDNFLVWVDERHEKIVELKAEVQELKDGANGGRSGAKAATFVKYRWYAEQLVLLEAINAFEAFYKKTFIELGKVVQEFVQPEVMKGVKIEARLLWTITGNLSVPALVFEQSLFHDLDAVDEASEMLVADKRYKQNSNNNPLAYRVRSLRGIFQIRHTLSHNNGLVTDSDAAKFKRLKFDITAKDIIDPVESSLGLAVFRELEAEAKDFTTWLAGAAASFLTKCVNDRGLAVPAAKRPLLETLLGNHANWPTVPWT